MTTSIASLLIVVACRVIQTTLWWTNSSFIQTLSAQMSQKLLLCVYLFVYNDGYVIFFYMLWNSSTQIPRIAKSSWAKIENYYSTFLKFDRSRGVYRYQNSFILNRLTCIEICRFNFSWEFFLAICVFNNTTCLFNKCFLEPLET